MNEFEGSILIPLCRFTILFFKRFWFDVMLFIVHSAFFVQFWINPFCFYLIIFCYYYQIDGISNAVQSLYKQILISRNIESSKLLSLVEEFKSSCSRLCDSNDPSICDFWRTCCQEVESLSSDAKSLMNLLLEIKSCIGKRKQLLNLHEKVCRLRECLVNDASKTQLGSVVEEISGLFYVNSFPVFVRCASVPFFKYSFFFLAGTRN
jgi:hypothetical protein